MTSDATATHTGSPGKTDTALRWVGDLDHPFYSDERNRYVWYEASAIAFQLAILSNYFVTGLVLWVAGADALFYALLFLAPTIIASIVLATYAQHHSAEYWPGINDLTRRRGQLGILAIVVLLSGLARAALDFSGASDAASSDAFLGGFGEGLLPGVLISPVGAIGVIMYGRRKQNKADQQDEF